MADRSRAAKPAGGAPSRLPEKGRRVGRAGEPQPAPRSPRGALLCAMPPAPEPAAEVAEEGWGSTPSLPGRSGAEGPGPGGRCPHLPAPPGPPRRAVSRGRARRSHPAAPAAAGGAAPGAGSGRGPGLGAGR